MIAYIGIHLYIFVSMNGTQQQAIQLPVLALG